MTESELIEEMDHFLCDEGMWVAFVERMKKKGYSEEEIEQVIKESKE